MATTKMHGRLAASLAIPALLALAPLAASAAPVYTVTPITGKYTFGADMNDAGQVAVNSRAPEVPFHTAYISDVPMNTGIPGPAGADTVINGINNRADAVGYLSGAGQAYPFAYTDGRLRDLGATRGMSAANDINDRGDIAGQVGQRGALARADGKVEVFGPEITTPAALNARGEVVGLAVDAVHGNQAFLYADHAFSRLDGLGGTYSSAVAINDAGAVGGDASTVAERYHAFLYEDGVTRDLTPSAVSSRAGGINNDGQVVGEVDGRAFLYANGAITDLNTLIAADSGWLLVSASAINNRRQILASACDPTGVFCYATVRLDPLPAVAEPNPGAMLAAGALLLCMRGLRRRAGSGLSRATADKSPAPAAPPRRRSPAPAAS